MKAFMYTHQGTGLSKPGLHNTSIRRSTLLRGKPNSKVVSERTSLGDRVIQAQNNPLLSDNPFLTALLVEPISDYKEVTFNATSVERRSDNLIYQGFLKLLTDPIRLTTMYDTAMLMEDLIELAYLTGGVQKAKQYVKLIPSSYVGRAGFGNLMSKILDETDNLGDSVFGRNDPYNYFNTSRFVTQFMQHSVQNLPTMSQRDAQVKRLFNIDEIIGEDNFKSYKILKPHSSEHWGPYLVNSVYVNAQLVDEQSPPFITIPVSHKRSIVYKFDGTFYHAMDTLGENDMLEYELDANVGVSTFENNRVNNSDLQIKSVEDYNTRNTPLAANQAFEAGENSEKSLSSTPIVNHVKLREVKRGLGANDLTANQMYDSISMYSTDPLFSKIAGFISSVIKDDFPISFIKGGASRGRTNLSVKEGKVEVRIYPDKILSNPELEYTMVHEGVHAITLAALRNNPEIEKELEAIIKKVISNMSPDLQETIRAMINAKDKIGLHEMGYYGLYDTKELLAEALTNKAFQKILRATPYEGKSLWKTIMDRISNLFEKIFGYTPGADALSAVFDLTLQLTSSPVTIIKEGQPGIFNVEDASELPLLRTKLPDNEFRSILQKRNIC
jgi:hypothetical protein